MSSRTLSRVVPNVLVFAVLAGVAWWGHAAGWKLPKFSAVTGTALEAKDDWCKAHSVPESVCVECNADLLPRPKSFGWCEVHGVHECPLCHPEVAQRHVPFVVTSDDLDRATRALEFDRPRNKEKSTLHQRRIQFGSDDAFRKAKLDTDFVRRAEDLKATIRETIGVYGEITYDPTRVAHLSSRAAGSVAKVYKRLGSRVEEGELLALVDASEVGKAKNEFLQAAVQLDVKQQDRDRLGTSTPFPTIAAADAAVREAKLRLHSARQMLINLRLPRSAADFKAIAEQLARGAAESELAQRLHFLGIPEELRKGLDPETDSNNLLPLRAPMRGIVVSHDIVAGEVVDTSRTLFEVVDPSLMWLTLHVRPEDVAKVEPEKSKIVFKPDGLGKEVEGTIAWVSTDADPKTRTVKVRAEIDNKEGRWRANTFGTGKIVLREEPKAIVVPNVAVHWEGDCHVVFVRDKDWFKEGSYKVFHTRVVRIGARDDKFTEIIAGVLPGEIVATNGSEILRAELLRGNLGAGCCAND